MKDQIFNPGKNISRVILLLFFLSPVCSSQPKTNLDIFYSLVDSSANALLKEVPSSIREADIEMNMGEAYSVLATEFISVLNRKNIISGSARALKLIYVIDNAKIEYSEMFRDGFLGNYLMVRTASLDGNFLVAGLEVNKFHFASTDTIEVDKADEIENYAYPFTQGEIPTEPFFSGLFEPAVAIGTAAAAVILFFTVRSR